MNLFQKILQKNNVYEFLPLTKTGIRTGMALCSEISILQPICIGIIILVSGYDLDQLNKVLKLITLIKIIIIVIFNYSNYYI